MLSRGSRQAPWCQKVRQAAHEAGGAGPRHVKGGCVARGHDLHVDSGSVLGLFDYQSFLDTATTAWGARRCHQHDGGTSAWSATAPDRCHYPNVGPRIGALSIPSDRTPQARIRCSSSPGVHALGEVRGPLSDSGGTHPVSDLPASRSKPVSGDGRSVRAVDGRGRTADPPMKRWAACLGSSRVRTALVPAADRGRS